LLWLVQVNSHWLEGTTCLDHLGKTDIKGEVMQLTQYQIERIKRFFTAVTALSAKPEIRLNPKQAKIALRVLMDPVKTPSAELPVVELLDAQATFFDHLSAYGERSRRSRRFFQSLLAISFGISCYMTYARGVATGLAFLIATFLIVFILNLVTVKFYVWRGFSPLKYGLTRTEVEFALDVILADQRWRHGIDA
jgi:hypothetical protein